MDLLTFKQVAFAAYTESDTGIMGKDPGELLNTWTIIDCCSTIEQVRDVMAPELIWKLDNYILAWELNLAPSDDASMDDKVEITESGIQAVELEPGTMKPIPITEKPAEDPPVPAPGKPERKRGKSGR